MLENWYSSNIIRTVKEGCCWELKQIHAENFSYQVIPAPTMSFSKTTQLRSSDTGVTLLTYETGQFIKVMLTIGLQW